MPISRNNDTLAFFANVDRLFKLIHNVIAKGQTKAAEKYIVYLFETITRYYIKDSNAANLREEFFDFSVATSDVNIESSVTVKKTLLGDYHKIKSYRNEFHDDIIRLHCSQVKQSNYETFSFVFNLLKDTTGLLLNDPKTLKGGRKVISTFKFIGEYVLFNKSSIPPSERHAYLHQTYTWFLDLLSVSIKDEDALIVLTGEFREVLRSYIDGDELQLFESFLNSLSSRFFPFTLMGDQVLEKYAFDVNDNYESRVTIDRYTKILSSITSVKIYKKVISDFEAEVNGKDNWLIDREEYKRDVKAYLFNIFKLTYCQVVIVDAISYSLLKEKFDFLQAYLGYHSPDDADVIWINENYSLQRFSDIIPFLEDYDKLMQDSLMWVDRHGIKKYINTFLGYYLIERTDENEFRNYIESIESTDVLGTVFYNLQDIAQKNILFKLPPNFIPDEKLIAKKLKQYISITEIRQRELKVAEVQNAIIDNDIRDGFFNNFFQSFTSQAVARAIYSNFDLKLTGTDNGQNIGINQRFPRQAFIKQGGSMFLSPHSQLARVLADNETTYIFRQIAKRATKLEMSARAFEEHVSVVKDKFDLLISANTYNIKASYPSLNFKESWVDDNPLKKLPGYLGKLNDQLEVFWLGERLPRKIFMLLSSQNLGKLIECEPPALSGDYDMRHEQFAFSFIDLAKDDEYRKRLMDLKLDEEKLKSEVWIRIFECIQVNLPLDFHAEYIEIIS